jgi:hypothetical protein
MCSARGALKLHKKGIRIFHLSQLHAKVYLFDRSAIVTSANLSESSEKRFEAGVLVTDRSLLEEIRKYVHGILHDPETVELNRDLLKARIRVEPKNFPKPDGAPPPKPKWPYVAARVWLLPCCPDDNETQRENTAKRRYVKQNYGDDSRIEWFNECGKALYQRVHDHDTVFLMWNSTNRRPYGWLEGPFTALDPADLGARFKERRYCLPIIRVGTKKAGLTANEFKRLLQLQGDKRPIDQAAQHLSGQAKLLQGLERTRLISLAKRIVKGGK